MILFMISTEHSRGFIYLTMLSRYIYVRIEQYF